MKKIKSWFNKFFLGNRFIIVIFIFNLTILLLHIFRAPFVLIDNTTILLMALVLITPFASHIKKIKWGDFEAELDQDIQKLQEQAQEIDVKEVEPEVSLRTEVIAKELRELAQKDKVLALAKLRIEIEMRLKKLFTFKENSSAGIRTMTQTLAATGVISNKLRNLISDITSILNRVVHGEDIPTEANIDKVLEVGIEIINELDYIFFDKIIKPSTKKVLSKKNLEEYMDAVYEVVSVVPLVEKPYINKRVLNQEQMEEFLEGYDEYAEFLVEIKKI